MPSKDKKVKRFRAAVSTITIPDKYRSILGVCENFAEVSRDGVKRFGEVVSTITIPNEDRSILVVCEDFVGYFRGRKYPPNHFTKRISRYLGKVHI